MPLLLRLLRAALLAGIVTVAYVFYFNIHENDSSNQHRRRLSSWSDPRTTVGKRSTMQRQDNGLDIAKLRIVAFGTSKTWGAGLDHPEREVRNYSYWKIVCCVMCVGDHMITNADDLRSILVPDVRFLVVSSGSKLGTTLHTCRLSISMSPFHDW